MKYKTLLALFGTGVLTSSLLADSAQSIVDKEMKSSDVESKYIQKQTIDAKKDLKQSINLGFSNTTGNTETLTFNAKYKLSFTTVGYNDEALKIAFDASAFVTENNNIRDNEEYVLNLGLEQYIADGWLGYTTLNWLQNKFQNYDNKFSVGIGVGKELFHTDQHSLKIKIGTAYNIEDYSNNQAQKEFSSLNEYIEYNNQLNTVSDLYVKLGSMQNFKDFTGDYEVLGVIGFNFAVAENISLSLEEEVKYDALPPAGFKNTDTKSIIRVGYNF